MINTFDYMSRFHDRINRTIWQPIRLQVLRRDFYKCVKCGRAGAALEVDHIQPLGEGGAYYDLNNLQSLCRDPCHFDKTKREREQQIANRGKPKVRKIKHTGWASMVQELS